MSSFEVAFLCSQKSHFLCVCKKSQIYYLDLRVVLEMERNMTLQMVEVKTRIWQLFDGKTNRHDQQVMKKLTSKNRNVHHFFGFFSFKFQFIILQYSFIRPNML